MSGTLTISTIERRPYRRVMLTLLTLIAAFNSVDRLALGLLLQNIKVDLGLSDTELGLLTGLAFAVFYSLMGIPIARLADRGDRARIIALTVGLWSVAVALCGAATSFIQLLLIRVWVAIGEAGCVPPAHSLMADEFERSERPRAMAIYVQSGPLSAVIGFFFAGWLNSWFGWRWTFVILGVPGLVLGLLAYHFLQEPRRAARRARQTANSAQPRSPGSATTAPTGPTLFVVCRVLIANPSFRNILLAFSIIAFFSFGILMWQPAFFVRSYGLNSSTIGTVFAVVYGLAGVIGTYLGGDLAARFAPRDERRQMRAGAILYIGFGALCAGVYLAPNAPIAFLCLGLAMVGGAMLSAPLFALIQSLVPSPMRATAVAFIYLCANLIGMGLGPLAVGVLSDALRPMLGEESLRYALVALCPGYLWAAFHLWLASRTVMRDIEIVASDDVAPPSAPHAEIVAASLANQ